MYKVFLSSTSRDLTAYREAVHRAIDGLPGFQLIKMEDFGARDASSEGSLRPARPGVRFAPGPHGPLLRQLPAERERFLHRAGVQNGKGRRSAPADVRGARRFSIPISLRESDASFKRQQALRREVMSERVVASFATPEQLASAVTRALFVWSDEQRQAAQPVATEAGEAPVRCGAAEAKRPLGENPYRGLEAFRKEDADRSWARGPGRSVLEKVP